MPDLRKDPILGRWVIISSERGKRPSDFTLPHENRREGGFCPFDSGNEHTTPAEILAYRERHAGQQAGVEAPGGAEQVPGAPDES